MVAKLVGGVRLGAARGVSGSGGGGVWATPLPAGWEQAASSDSSGR